MTSKRVGFGLAAAVALAIGYAAIKSRSAIDTSLCYVNQFGATMHVQTAPGRTFGIGPAHGTCIVDLRGVCVGLFDEQPISGPETRYQMPGPESGELAIKWWKFYWEGSDFKDADGKWHSNRCYSLPPGRIAPEPPSVVAPCNSTFSKVPRSPSASGVFAPTLFKCNPTPGPTMQPTTGITPCWGTQNGCVTPRPTPPGCPTCIPCKQTPGATVTPSTGCVIHCPAGAPCGTTGCANTCTGESGVPCQ